MGRIAFVTDSTAGMPVDQVKKYNVMVVPLQLMFGNESFRDGIDLTQDEFFARLEAAATLPTTSQPSRGAMLEAYSKLAHDPDVDSIVGVHISSKLSGTVGTASSVAQELIEETGKKISVIDSLSAYMGEGLMIIDGARAAQEGKSHEEVVELIGRMIPRMRILLLVDTLEYLQRGGRIGGGQAFLGTLLNVKPILQVKDGRIEPLERVRTRRRAMERLADLGAEYAQGAPTQIAVGHAQAAGDASLLSEMVHQTMSVAEEFTSDLGPVISTHTGPGVLGFVYYPLEGWEKI